MSFFNSITGEMKNKPLLIFLAASGVGLWLFLLLVLFSKCAAQQQPNLYLPPASQSIWHKEKTGRYEFANPTKMAGWGLIILASFVDGATEGFEFDGRKSWERKFGANPHGFFGSESWRRLYVGGDPANGKVKGYQRHFGAWDSYHLGDDFRKLGYISGGVTLAIGGQQVNSKWWHYAIDVGVALGISMVAKREGILFARY